MSHYHWQYNDVDIIIATIEILYDVHLKTCRWWVCPLWEASLLVCVLYIAGGILLCPGDRVEGYLLFRDFNVHWHQ